jgi:hypothetical protein
MHKTRPFLLLLVVVLLFGAVTLSVAQTDSATLNVNRGTASDTFFISGERTLVMNLFDLNQFGLTPPITINSVTINVAKAMPQTPVDVVIYSDKDGGSPANALLSRRETLPDIGQTGAVTINLAAPVTVGDRFIWAGFYLPVGFEFFADLQGSSSLTYWGWTPNGTFDLNNLTTAQVLGPGNGTEPVSISMGGVARITLGVTFSGQSVISNLPTSTPQIRQIPGETGVNLAPMVAYPNCQTLFYDSADVVQTYGSGITVYCKLLDSAQAQANLTGYAQRGPLFDFYLFGVPSGASPLPYEITHCIRPAESEIATAIIGLKYGAPRQWELLPTVRYGDLVCAEVKYSGYLSVFTPN